jgi:hypothetical protein
MYKAILKWKKVSIGVAYHTHEIPDLDYST